MREALWPDGGEDHAREVPEYFRNPPARWRCLVVEAGAAGVVGFLEVGTRDYAEGCATSPVGYLEGIWVDPPFRGRGAARALVEAGEAWARARGCAEMASDRAPENEASGRFHEALGYVEEARIVCMRKRL